MTPTTAIRLMIIGLKSTGGTYILSKIFLKLRDTNNHHLGVYYERKHEKRKVWKYSAI